MELLLAGLWLVDLTRGKEYMAAIGSNSKQLRSNPASLSRLWKMIGHWRQKGKLGRARLTTRRLRQPMCQRTATCGNNILFFFFTVTQIITSHKSKHQHHNRGHFIHKKARLGDTFLNYITHNSAAGFTGQRQSQQGSERSWLLCFLK